MEFVAGDACSKIKRDHGVEGRLPTTWCSPWWHHCCSKSNQSCEWWGNNKFTFDPFDLENIVVAVEASRSRYHRAFDEFHPSFTMCGCGWLLEAENRSFGGSLQTKRLCNIWPETGHPGSGKQGVFCFTRSIPLYSQSERERERESKLLDT